MQLSSVELELRMRAVKLRMEIILYAHQSTISGNLGWWRCVRQADMDVIVAWQRRCNFGTAHVRINMSAVVVHRPGTYCTALTIDLAELADIA